MFGLKDRNSEKGSKDDVIISKLCFKSTPRKRLHILIGLRILKNFNFYILLTCLFLSCSSRKVKYFYKDIYRFQFLNEEILKIDKISYRIYSSYVYYKIKDKIAYLNNDSLTPFNKTTHQFIKNSDSTSDYIKVNVNDNKGKSLNNIELISKVENKTEYAYTNKDGYAFISKNSKSVQFRKQINNSKESYIIEIDELAKKSDIFIKLGHLNDFKVDFKYIKMNDLKKNQK